MASVTKRGNVWSVRYRITDALGKESMKRVSGFRTKEEAWEAARKLEAASNAGIDVNGDRASCGEIMERWFQEHVLPNVAKTTASRYASAIDILAKLPVYNMPVRKMSPSAFAQFLVALQEREPGRIISPVTAFSYADPLRLSLGWATAAGIIPRNPIQGYRRPKSSPRVQRILNERDVADLVEASRGKPIHIPLLLALYGGLRREECAGLTWDYIDFERGTVSLVAAITSTVTGKRVEKEVKSTHSMRTVPLPPFVMSELKALPKVSRYVCTSSNGASYGLDSYRQAVHRLVALVNRDRLATSVAPMPDVNFHDLRHTHAAMLIKLKIQPKVIQERLGHASIKITMDLYGYLMTGLQESVADALELQFHNQSGGHESGHRRPINSEKTGLTLLANEN